MIKTADNTWFVRNLRCLMASASGRLEKCMEADPNGWDVYQTELFAKCPSSQHLIDFCGLNYSRHFSVCDNYYDSLPSKS